MLYFREELSLRLVTRSVAIEGRISQTPHIPFSFSPYWSDSKNLKELVFCNHKLYLHFVHCMYSLHTALMDFNKCVYLCSKNTNKISKFRYYYLTILPQNA